MFNMFGLEMVTDNWCFSAHSLIRLFVLLFQRKYYLCYAVKKIIHSSLGSLVWRKCTKMNVIVMKLHPG